jgi:predicted O-methyltransferase YrrM
MKVFTHFLLWNLGLASAETQTTEAERESLARHASGKKHLAEIGVWHGVTTCRLRSAMSPDGTLVAIDPYPTGRLHFSAQRVIARREVSKIPSGSVRWVRKTGAEAANHLVCAGSEQFDFVFIDGDHSYEGLKGDWLGWSGLVAACGVVGLHDSRPTATRRIENAGSVRFTRDVILQDPRFEVVDEVDSLTMLRRK